MGREGVKEGRGSDGRRGVGREGVKEGGYGGEGVKEGGRDMGRGERE